MNTGRLKAFALVSVLWLLPCQVAYGKYSGVTKIDEKLRDFLIMDVCIDKDGHILQITPLDKKCTVRRNINPGETPPYYMRDYNDHLSDNCRSMNGSNIKFNIPIVSNEIERVVSSYIKVSMRNCNPYQERSIYSNNSTILSIQGVDTDYAFIMASGSKVAPSYWTGSECRTGDNSSRRFERGWIVASKNIFDSPLKVDFGVFKSRIANTNISEVLKSCPPTYSSGFTFWIKQRFEFTNNASTEAIISEHFPRSGPSGDSAGDSMQSERTYWTSEFGLTRWEKWARSDWVHPRWNLAAAEIGLKMRKSPTCSYKSPISAKISASMQISSMDKKSDTYSEERIIDGKSTIWIMTQCRDFSNIKTGDVHDEFRALHGILNRAMWQ